MLHQNTIEGFFADPIYGGNRDKVGWRLVGFPGVGAAYFRHFKNYNEPYLVEPVGIEDIVNRRAELDEHGHVAHVPLSPKRKG
jgi:gluconate 2-dehydrogenase gamma chain